MSRASSAQSKDLLKLDEQICFPLYAASRLVTRLYQPLLEPLGLTYTQYIVLLILWEDAPCSVSHIGERAQLASNTLTPLLKKLEQLGYVSRERASDDERVLNVGLTPAGKKFKARCAGIPMQLFERVGYTGGDVRAFKQQLQALLHHLQSLPELDSSAAN
jgi:MarR family transcriptional regulator, organic hydroperoxide resistance regulator